MPSNNTDLFVDKYNFSRRVVDHRQPHDLNFSINKSIGTRLWMKAWKQRLIGNFLNTIGTHYAVVGASAALIVLLVDAWTREKYDQPFKSQLLHGRQPYGHTFIANYRNATTAPELGRWNHNFGCFERSASCGRDFD